ncbi:hypothetical protein SNE35_24555 [Paucibacter sp. R3-3]|uniref:DUF2158 domain-containing protein n=1 Tax=Roseateles agri TaxID=3098619 RepID=A0ABU5DN06_9BURK|nr:hypothetical protein [Paucibacter sp. R3-3]MDY0747697.1 hypothetical protein [Paucibacter sp. R3-3]
MKVDSIQQGDDGPVAVCVWYDSNGEYLQRVFPLERLEEVHPGTESPPIAG